MQTIKHIDGYKNAHWLLDEVENLYAELSVESVDSGLIRPTYDVGLEQVFDNFERYSIYSWDKPDFVKQSVEKLSLPQYDKKNIIVCYSGGKDSLCAVMHYKRLGYNVIAYHIKGLNKTYVDEWKTVERASKELGFDVIFDEVGYVGQHMWVEHPMKNMLMANMALTWGIQHNFTTKIAVGTFYTATLSSDDFHVCGGDAIDMWEAYENIVRRFIPKFHMYVSNCNYKTAFNWLFKEPKYLQYTISCLTPVRFRQLFRNRTLDRYHVELLPNRCGCCWKCATEYLLFCDKGIFEYDEQYYIHCLEVLVDTMSQECGYRVYNLNRVWNKYMFYPMSKSKAKETLKNAIVSSRKIKITVKDTEG